MSRIDYKLDDNFDITVENGDLKIGESDQNHKAVNIIASKGHIRQYVRIGVNITKEVNGVYTQDTKRRILESLKKDGYNIKGIKFSGNEIIIP